MAQVSLNDFEIEGKLGAGGKLYYYYNKFCDKYLKTQLLT